MPPQSFRGKMEKSVANNQRRVDFEVIRELIPAGARVLDLGCGSGELLSLLAREKSVIGQGVEIDPANISLCVAQGVPAIQADVDQGLQDYPDHSFDFVILNQTLQQVKNPERVLEEMTRVGKFGIVGFHNFGHWRVRLQLLLHGRLPRTPEFPEPWFSSPNLHLLTAGDFEDFCAERGLVILKRIMLGRKGQVWPPLFASARGVSALYLLGKGNPKAANKEKRRGEEKKER